MLIMSNILIFIIFDQFCILRLTLNFAWGILCRHYYVSIFFFRYKAFYIYLYFIFNHTLFSISLGKSSQELLRSDFFFCITGDRAQDACKPHELENREEYLRESGIPIEQEFWIGKAVYKEPTRWIEIIGNYNLLDE